MVGAPSTVELPSAAVFIVDDDVTVRRTFAKLFAAVGIETNCFASGREFLDSYCEERHSCILLDYQMPGLNGVEVQHALHKNGFQTPVIFVTGEGDVPFAVTAMQHGAFDILVKPVHPERLLHRVQEALEADLTGRRKRSVIADIHDRLSRLTPRERQIADLLAAGESCKQIAHGLSICAKTVENHRAAVLEKMNVDNPTQLAHLLDVLN